MAHPPAFWYTNQFELPCCKEKTRSPVIMFAKETFRLLFTKLIVTLSFTNGFIIIKISDDLPTYCSLLPLIRGEDNVFQLLESIHRKIHQPANAKTMWSHVFGVFGNFPDRHLPPIIADMKKNLIFLSQFCAHLHRLVNNVHGKYMVCNVQAKARCKIGSRGKLHQEWKKGHGQDAWDAWCMFCWERGRFFLLCHMQCTQMNVRAKHELLLSVVFWDANTILYPV